MNRAEKEQALKTLNEEWSTKDLPLKSTATNVVPGEGNPDTDILFIGEAPGKNEDLQGRPFVGAAGQLLNKLLESIGLKREDVFIANIIKHRPPNNRDPLPDEIAAYSPWLAEQIKIIDPKLVVTLGRFSMDYMLGSGFSISKIHGQPKRRNGRVIMPVYHPAAVLYKRDWLPALEADFKKIPKVVGLIKEGEIANTEKSSTNNQKPLL